MSSVDERMVEMKFKNSEFEQGIKSTLTALDSLKKVSSLREPPKV
jgi:hypothetical protein